MESLTPGASGRVSLPGNLSQTNRSPPETAATGSPIQFLLFSPHCQQFSFLAIRAYVYKCQAKPTRHQRQCKRRQLPRLNATTPERHPTRYGRGAKAARDTDSFLASFAPL